MPDCHVGFGVTIGCVFPTLDSVIPNAVGVDIGCGMCAVNTGVPLDRGRMDKGFWREWMGQVQRNVPTGFGAHKSPQEMGDLDRPLRATSLQKLLTDKARYQIGTLGGGNHFMEAQVDQDGAIWLMVHSGSRHTGLRIADLYNRAAISSSEQRDLPVGRDLASPRIDEQLGQDYLADMEWATDFALENRLRMIQAMVEAFADQLDRLLHETGRRRRISDQYSSQLRATRGARWPDRPWCTARARPVPRLGRSASSRVRWARRAISSGARGTS